MGYNKSALGKMVFEFRQKWQIGNHSQFSSEEQECYNAMLNYNGMQNFKPHYAANIAVAEFVDTQGTKNYIMRISVNKKAAPEFGKHSEELIIEFLKANQIPLPSVTNWYSEIQPCNQNYLNHNCENLLKKETPNASVAYSFEYEYYEQHRIFINQTFV